MAQVPAIRLRRLNDEKPKASGKYVLVWMTAFRRSTYNFTLDRACELAVQLKKPLVVLEALRCDYPWASDRLHAFIIQGMADNAAAFAKAKITYYPYIEQHKKDGAGLLRAAAKDAAVVVTDDYPGFFLPHMINAATAQINVYFEAVDSNGLLPLRAVDKTFPTAYAFRRTLQKMLPEHLDRFPRSKLYDEAVVQKGALSKEITSRWPSADQTLLALKDSALSHIDIDHSVHQVALKGGAVAAQARLNDFMTNKLKRYGEDRNHPDLDGQSGLSPYLHFGHVSAHAIFAALAKEESWSRNHLSSKTSGSREGFWGMSTGAEGFLDEAVTWRELGYNMAAHDYDALGSFKSLPEWAKTTLSEHSDDPREQIYSLKQLEQAQTDDPIWNAAQIQLVREGSIHNYLRMLWGKRVITWTKRPIDAFRILEELNNKYAIDGRDPNSYSGILWCFGRYDRPWPEHDIFGKVRMMTSASTRRKLKLKEYLEKYSHTAGNQGQAKLFD